MTVQETISFLENNYNEIDLFDHIDLWQKWSMADNTVYSLCQERNDTHNLVIQALVQQAQNGEGLQDKPIDEIYISYKDEEINVKKAFTAKEELEQLIYQDILDIDFDMKWVV